MLDRLGSSHLKIGQCADMWTPSQVSNTPSQVKYEIQQERRVGERILVQGWEKHLYNGIACKTLSHLFVILIATNGRRVY